MKQIHWHPRIDSCDIGDMLRLHPGHSHSMFFMMCQVLATHPSFTVLKRPSALILPRRFRARTASSSSSAFLSPEAYVRIWAGSFILLSLEPVVIWRWEIHEWIKQRTFGSTPAWLFWATHLNYLRCSYVTVVLFSGEIKPRWQLINIFNLYSGDGIGAQWGDWFLWSTDRATLKPHSILCSLYTFATYFWLLFLHSLIVFCLRALRSHIFSLPSCSLLSISCLSDLLWSKCSLAHQQTALVWFVWKQVSYFWEWDYDVM